MAVSNFLSVWRLIFSDSARKGMRKTDKIPDDRTIVLKNEAEFFDLIDRRLRQQDYELLETVLSMSSKKGTVADDLDEPV